MDLLSVLLAVCCLYHLVCSAVPRAFVVGRGYTMLTYELLAAVPWLVMGKIKIILYQRQEDVSELCGMLILLREQGQKLNQDASNTKAAIQGNSFP